MVKKKNIASEIGQLIREIRLERGLSQEQLSFRCELHRTYIGAVERAEKVASLITIEKIATALDISLAELFKRHEQARSDKRR